MKRTTALTALVLFGAIPPSLVPTALAQSCAPDNVPGKHGTPNNYNVPFNSGVSHWIKLTFRMYDDGRIEAPLTYENDSVNQTFCGGVHIRLGDSANNAIAHFYSDPTRCMNGKSPFGGGPSRQTYSWSFRTTPEVACRYAHLFIEPNRDHPDNTSSAAPAAPERKSLPFLCVNGHEITRCAGNVPGAKCVYCTSPAGHCKCPVCQKEYYEITHTHTY